MGRGAVGAAGRNRPATVAGLLTIYEQSKHAEERERVLEAMGQRAARGDNRHSRPATVAGLEKTTDEIAKQAGMSERSWQTRAKIGRSWGMKKGPGGPVEVPGPCLPEGRRVPLFYRKHSRQTPPNPSHLAPRRSRVMSLGEIQ